MIRKLLYGGGIFFLLLTVIGWVAFYRSSPSENEEIKQEFKKNGFSYSLFLKSGYISVSSDKTWKSLRGIGVSRAFLSLKDGSFSLNGNARVGFIKNSDFLFRDFKGTLCGKYRLRAKRISVSVANSKVHSFMIEDFTIKGNRLFLFSKRKKKINIKLFCFNPLRALNYEEKQHQ